MKKSLVIISFAFIFLLTLSVVNAGLWITGDVQQKAGSTTIRKASISGGPDSNTGSTFSRTSGVSATSSQRRSSDTTNRGPGIGWVKTISITGEDCWYKNAGKRSLFTR